jgi:hypothetical protein
MRRQPVQITFVLLLFCEFPEAQFIVPDWGGGEGVKVDYDIGLLYRIARLHRLRYENPITWSTLSPQSGTVYLATANNV